MKRETLKKEIDKIIIEQCGLDKNFFSYQTFDGENMIIEKELIKDPLDWYEILSAIEYKCNILINDELIIKPDITYGEFIDVFYEEIQKEKNGLY